jgi:DNA-binding PadR family transcriptional regulator
MTKTKPGIDESGHLTPVVFHSLLALSKGPLHGYAISREVEQVTDGSVRMGPGTLYGSLQRMQAAGYVEQVGNVGATGAHSDRRRYYALTGAGRMALEREAHRLEKAVDLYRTRAILERG